MAIRHMSYLACDVCLNICDDSDADRAADCRAIGRRRGWKRVDGRDLCPTCQAA